MGLGAQGNLGCTIGPGEKRREGEREVGETFRRLSGEASELGVVSEGADQGKVQSFG